MLVSSALELLIPAQNCRTGRVPGGFFHDHEDFYIKRRSKPFVIMKRLVRHYARKSQLPPHAHSPGIPGASIADNQRC
jgi:hypothetical protein